MTIKINNVVINAEVMPLDKPSLDETLEMFTFALANSDVAMPYAPMQKVEITTDDNEIISLLIVTDNVEIFSLSPLRYKHSLTCIENTRFLSKHIVRNSIISQPDNPIKESENSVFAIISGEYTDDNSYVYSKYIRGNSNPLQTSDINIASRPLHLASKERVSKAYIRLYMNTIFNDTPNGSQDIMLNNVWKDDFITFNEVLNFYRNAGQIIESRFTYHNTIKLKYTLNGNTLYENLNLNDFIFNKDIKLPIVKTLADSGANDFELLFDYELPIEGEIYGMSPVDTPFNVMFGYLFKMKLIVETYYYNAYDVLDLLLKRQQQHFEVGFYSFEKSPLFTLPASGDLYNLLNSTIAPNFTFTQMTFYDCVAEVFKLFDAIFTLDENNVLGITYFNVINDTPITTDFSNKSLSIGEDNYNNGLVSYFQDARVNEFFPSENDFATVRSLEFSVPEAQDHNFILPHRIHHIKKVEFELTEVHITLASVYITSTLYVKGSFALDISNYVVEASIWSLLNKNTDIPSSNYQLVQNNTVYYMKDSNYINLAYTYKNSIGTTKHAFKNVILVAFSRFFGATNNDISTNLPSIAQPTTNAAWNKYRMRAIYEATIDGRTQVETITNKYEGQTIVDQSSGAVDLNKLGLNMLGLSLKLGEPTLNATQKITTWSNRIKIGDVYLFEGKRWIANVVAYTLFNGFVQTKVSFVKDFNSLSLRTRLLRERRFSNISNELVSKSEDNIVQFAYFSTSRSLTSYSLITAIDSASLVLCTYLSFKHDTANEQTLDLAFIESNNQQFFIPLVIYGAGNSINFEMSFNEPMNAGNRTTYGQVQTWYGANKYFTDASVYTDENGFLDNVNIKLVKNSNYTFDENFPILSEDFSNNIFAHIDNYKVYKQPNEIFALNYEIVFMPFDKDNDFLGSEFINSNFFTNRKSIDRELYLFYSTNEKYNVLDTKGIGTRKSITNITFSSGVYSITFTTDLIPAHVSWAICDENNNILFASNSGSNSFSTTKTIYFAMRDKRI